MYLNCFGGVVISRTLMDDEKEYIMSKLEYCSDIVIEAVGRRSVINIWDSCGCDVVDDLEAINQYLKERRVSIVPEGTQIRYTGDLEGGYVYADGLFDSYVIDDYIIRTTPSEELVAELRRRGLRVTVSER